MSLLRRFDKGCLLFRRLDKGWLFLRRFDEGWLYLLCGLALTVAAIILPAHHDLEQLEQKRDAIALDLADLQYQQEIYQAFLTELQRGDPQLMQRIIEMQLNKPVDGTPVVIDKGAAKTPLDWIALRARQDRVIDTTLQHSSMLAELANSRGRLWLAGAGIFSIFVGLVRPTHQQIDRSP